MMEIVVIRWVKPKTIYIKKITVFADCKGKWCEKELRITWPLNERLAEKRSPCDSNDKRMTHMCISWLLARNKIKFSYSLIVYFLRSRHFYYLSLWGIPNIYEPKIRRQWETSCLQLRFFFIRKLAIINHSQSFRFDAFFSPPLIINIWRKTGLAFESDGFNIRIW